MWFVERSFFVILDEAIGDAPGALDLHFQFAPGDVQTDTNLRRASTRLTDANVSVTSVSDVTLEEEDGWTAGDYGAREPRGAIRFRHAQPAPAAFLTLVLPYKGNTPPNVTATLSPTFQVGADLAEVQAKAFDKSWTLRRDLATGDASVRAVQD